jgi:hypothetical protein
MKTTIRRSPRALSAAWICLAALAACSGDDANATDAGPSAGKSGGGGSHAGHGGSTAGRSGSGAAGSSQAGGVKCGSMMCMASGPAAGFIDACCADEATSTCGTSIMGNPCSKPVADDPRCPGVNVMGFIMLPSCCAQNGMCGIDASMFGMPGCVDLATAAKQAMSMGGGADLPAARACDGADGGAEDAGS